MTDLTIHCPIVGCDWVFPDMNSLKKHEDEVHRAYQSEVRSVSATGGQKGVKLERFDLIPTGPLAELARHYGVGAKKYADHQWRKGIDWSKCYAAAMRHWNAFWGGEEYDCCPPDGAGCAFETYEGEPYPAGRNEHGLTCYNHTGSHHLAAAAWQAFCLMELRDTHPELDDRYLGEPNGVQR